VHVCIAIPTFRRTQQLEKLLGDIATQSLQADVGVDVLVLDNDAVPSAKGTVDRVGTAYPHRLVYQHVAEPGLCAVRNRALQAARNYDCLVMIDDDERPATEWLRELLRVAALTNADVVIGPVPQVVPDDAARWIRAGRFYDLPTSPDAAAITYGYSGNCLLRTSSLERFGVRFDPALNLAGGEDTMFFRQLIARGAQMRFAARAIAVETIDPSRLTASYILRLNFRRGNTLALCDRNLRGAPGVALRVVKACARLALGVGTLAPRAMLRGATGAVVALSDMAQGLGALAGLSGVVYNAYTRPLHVTASAPSECQP
jgi:succinoglycan biosynthesis protein ExoM